MNSFQWYGNKQGRDDKIFSGKLEQNSNLLKAKCNFKKSIFYYDSNLAMNL
jgi:hypothetical protein